MLTWNVLPFFLNVFLIVVIVARESRMIALGILIFIVLFSLIQYRVTNWLQPYQEKANKLLLSDTIGNALTVKTFAAFDREAYSFSKLNLEATSARTKQYLIFNLMWMISLVAVVFLEIGAVRYALSLRGKGSLEI